MTLSSNRSQAITLILIFLFAISALSAVFQYSTIDLLKDQLEDSEKTTEFIQEELSTSQDQINSLTSRVEFYKQLTTSYLEQVQSLQQKLMIRTEEGKTLPEEIIIIQMMAPSVRIGGSSERFVGVPLTIVIEIRPGTGKILVNTQPRMGLNIQSSVRLAANVAENLTGFTLADRDIIVSITAPEVVEGVDGPSAGGAMTVLMVAGLEGKQIKPDVMMTGTIELGGRIGPVGGIVAKAEAAAEAGATIFLIPKGQAEQILFREVTRQLLPGFEITTIEGVRIDLRDYAAEKWGLRVVEVEHITHALRLFLVAE